MSSMPVECHTPGHGEAFIRLNEQWIEEHFGLEEADRKLAADPYRIVREGGHILSLLAPSIALYRKHGFEAVSEGSHASYARCNVVMELLFAAPA